MKIEIKDLQKKDKHLEYLLSILPDKIKDYLCTYLRDNPLLRLDEIRLHSYSYMCIISSLSNIKTDLYITESDIADTVFSLCSGSIYSHFDTIKEGYISVGKGIRAGICGKASLQNGIISGISDFSSVNIRMPKRIYTAGDYIFNLLKENNFNSSILIYSAPGVGKTTILRELIYKLSSLPSPIRFSVIDSREEIAAGMDVDASMDLYLAYPKGTAINLATRTMTPQLIICDEISTEDETDAVLSSVNCGVHIIATTHASSFEELKAKKQILPLLNSSVFDYALGVERLQGSKKYIYSLNSLKVCYV